MASAIVEARYQRRRSNPGYRQAHSGRMRACLTLISEESISISFTRRPQCSDTCQEGLTIPARLPNV
jgi:hypothetical protein